MLVRMSNALSAALITTQPPARDRELARQLCGGYVAVVVSESADRNRVNIEIWRWVDGHWWLSGFSSSFAVVLLPAVTRALLEAQDARADCREQ